MHIHILGICGTFMGSLAVLAKQMGFRVSGSDTNCYPPMSTQLQEQDIEIIEGFDPEQLNPQPDLVVIGNAMSRGNPCVEAVLNQQIPYTSGPQWLCDYVLNAPNHKRHVIALSGTHGKTTTSSMVAHILHANGRDVGYLIGGVPQNFETSSYLGSDRCFVIEADEYDSAFFDKRSKFIHYQPRTLVINNLEFDHADIFENLAAIQKQFHHVIRTVPEQGTIIYPSQVSSIEQVIAKGCWSQQQQMAFDLSVPAQWHAIADNPSGTQFSIYHQQKLVGQVIWSLMGQHNVANGLSALIASVDVGISIEKAIKALNQFGGVKRRLEKLGTVKGITIYDDFAHHPTAITTTLQGLRASLGDDIKITAVIEPRSNTMKMGVHKAVLQDSTQLANQVFWSQPDNIDWNVADTIHVSDKQHIVQGIDKLAQQVVQQAIAGEHIVVMSNGGFGGFHKKLLALLNS